MDLNDYRIRIDEIDKSMTALFLERMAISQEIADYKLRHGLPIPDPTREREKLSALSEGVTEPMSAYLRTLYSMIFELSRAYQRAYLQKECPSESALGEKVRAAVQNIKEMLPPSPVVACQGVEGAYSQIACEKLFQAPNIMYFNSFEGVFSAIEHGLCRYGVLPVENSTAGSVNAIYDLMMKYDFSIVRSARIKADHCLLVNKGTAIDGISEIYSHEQALAQCSGFLKKLGNIKITPCENTAAAAKMLFESGRKDAAAIASSSCAELYGLDCLCKSIQDQGGNYTRFICVSKQPEIYPGADRTSIMLIVPHKPGALYHVLSRFYALGINLIKLESSPIPNSDFEFMFYFDIATSVYSDAFTQMFEGLDETCSGIKYLGSYLEVV